MTEDELEKFNLYVDGENSLISTTILLNSALQNQAAIVRTLDIENEGTILDAIENMLKANERVIEYCVKRISPNLN